MAKSVKDFLEASQIDKLLGKGERFVGRLPKLAYTSADYLGMEHATWLDRTWIMVGRAHELSNPGDMMPVHGQPFFLVRDKEGAIRAYHNACRHRGHELVSKPCTKSRRIVCPYHSWSYGLDGRLLSAPYFAGAKDQRHPDFDFGEFGLIPVRCGVWKNWIMINVDGNAPPLEDFAKPLENLFSDVNFSNLKHIATVEKLPMPVNWKIATENNVEPYHVPMVHTKTAAGQPLGDHRIISDGYLVGSRIDMPDAVFTNLPETKKANEHLDTSSRYCTRTPNLCLTSHAPDKIIDTIILPDRENPGQCWISHAIYSTSGAGMGDDELTLWLKLEEEVLDEDLAVMEGVARGMRSPTALDGIMSPVWEAGVARYYSNMLDIMLDQGTR
ncbi:MAG: aromatic ring-hydroxylating dioxygenase subunit alpha [Alphaproteobacteria bacterium]